MRPRLFIFASVVTAALLAYGCASESPTGPSSAPVTAPAASSQTLLGSLLAQPKTVSPLQRTTALKANVTASQTIGALGGVLSIPSAGITIVVPPLAVTKPTAISVTALAGSNVAYQFEPHGIKFTLPLVATQSLKGTQAQTGGLISPLSLFAGYFPDGSHVASITGLLNLNVNLLNQTSVFTIWHFSGYIIATGRSSEE